MIGRAEFGLRWFVVGWMLASWMDAATGTPPEMPAWVYLTVGVGLGAMTLLREAVRKHVA